MANCDIEAVIVLSVDAVTLTITAVSSTLNAPTIPVGSSIATVLDELLEADFKVKSVVGTGTHVIYTLVKE